MNVAFSAGSYVAGKPSLILPVGQVQVWALLPDMGIVGMQCTVHRIQLLAVMCKVVGVSHTGLPGMAWCTTHRFTWDDMGTAHRFTWDGMVHYTQVYLG